MSSEAVQSDKCPACGAELMKLRSGWHCTKCSEHVPSKPPAGAGQSVQSFAPAIRLPGGRIYTPTGTEWLMFFASCDCQWAIDALAEKEVRSEPAE